LSSQAPARSAAPHDIGEIRRLLAAGRVDSAAQLLVGIAVDDRRTSPLELVQIGLLLGDDAPEWLRQDIAALSASPDPSVRHVAARVMAAAVVGGRRAHALADAAYAVLWLDREDPDVTTRFLVVQLTAMLDGPDVAERRLALHFPDRQRTEPLVHLLAARIARERRAWGEVTDHSLACIEAGDWVARQAVPLLLQALRTSSDVERSLAVVESLPEALRYGDSDAVHALLLWRSERHEAASESWCRALRRGWATPDATFIKALPSLSWDPVFESLLTSSNENVLVALAGNPLAPSSVLRQLASIGVFEAIAVAGNPSAPADLLATLAARPETSVRRAVASAPHCPLEVLTDLAGDSESVVLTALRDNPASPDALRVRVALML